MSLPFKLKKMNLFVDGGSYLGVAGEVTLPKLARKMEGWRGAGMDGEIDIDMGGEKLELEASFGGLTSNILKHMGAARHDALMLRFAGGYQSDQTGAVTPIEVVMHGRIAEFDEGSGKPGDDTEHKYKFTLSYYKRIENGRSLVEIDQLAGTYIIDGVDRMAELNAAIGV